MNDLEQNKFSEVDSADTENAEQLEMKETKEIPQIEVPADNEETEPTENTDEYATPDGTEQLEIPMEISADNPRKNDPASEFLAKNSANNAGVFLAENHAEQPANASGFRSEEDAAYAAEYGEYLAKRRFNRTPLILALFGLMFSVFYGAGIVFGIIALVMGAARYRVHKSEPLRWAIVLSIVCIALSLAFIFALSGSALIAYIKQIEQDSQQGLANAFAREWFGR